MADAHASGVLPHGKAVVVEARSYHGRVFNSSSLSMHILEVGMHWFPEGGGGADRYFYGLVSELAHQDYAMKAFVFGEGKSPVGSHVRFLGSRDQSLRHRFLKLRKGVKEELARGTRPALIASHFSLYVFPLLDFLWRHPHVVHFHGPWADESAAEGEGSRAVYFKQAIERVTYATARRFVVLSKAFRDVLVTRYQIREDRIDVVPGGVQADVFNAGLSRAEARERLGWPKDRIILLTVRRLARRMGLENFIEAVAQLREKEQGILAVLAGTGPLAGELAALVERKNLQEHVKLVGFVPDADLPVAYRAADVSVVPSISLEGFGLIVLESLAAGTPVIVTPIGGLPEVVSGLSKDLILEGSSPAQIADGLAARLSALGKLPSDSACQAYAKDNFDWPVIAKKVIGVYEKCLQK